MAEGRHENQNDDQEEPERKEEQNSDGFKTVGGTNKRRKKAEKKKEKGKGKKKKEEEVYQTPISSPLHSGEEPQSDSTNTLHPDSSSLESDEDNDDDDHNAGQDDDISMTISSSYPDCAQPPLPSQDEARPSRPWSDLVRETEDGDLNLTKD